MGTKASRIARVVIGSALVAAASTAGVVATASAGGNGQHVRACTSHTRVDKIRIWGGDNNGNWQEIEQGVHQEGAIVCSDFWSWWKGPVTIRYTQPDGTAHEDHINVRTMWDLDWEHSWWL
jgi:hypothetical protein